MPGRVRNMIQNARANRCAPSCGGEFSSMYVPPSPPSYCQPQHQQPQHFHSNCPQPGGQVMHPGNHQSPVRVPQQPQVTANTIDMSGSARINEDGTMSITINANPDTSCFKVDTAKRGTAFPELWSRVQSYSPISGNTRATSQVGEDLNTQISYNEKGQAQITITFRADVVKSEIDLLRISNGCVTGHHKLVIDRDKVQDKVRKESGGAVVPPTQPEPELGVAPVEPVPYTPDKESGTPARDEEVRGKPARKEDSAGKPARMEEGNAARHEDGGRAARSEVDPTPARSEERGGKPARNEDTEDSVDQSVASQQPSFRLSEITTIPKQQNIITPASAQNTAQAKNAHAPTADLTHVYKEKQAHLDLSFEQKKKELSETLKIHDPSQEDHLSRILELFKNEFLSNPMWEPSRGEKEVLTKELLSLENTNSNPFTTPTLAFLPLAYQKNLTEKTVGDWLNEVTPLLQEMGKNNQNLRARH